MSGLRIPRWVDKVLLGVGIALVIGVLWQVPLGGIRDAVVGMWPGVLLAPLVGVSWFTTSTTAMWLLLDREVGWLRILWIRLVGDSYNALLPLAGFGGEPFKVRQLSRFVDPAIVMATLIRDRIIDNAVGFLFGAGELMAGLAAYTVAPSVRDGLITYLAICGLLGLLGMALIMTRVPGKLGTWLAKVLGDVAPEQIETLPAHRVALIALCFVGSRMLGLLEKVVLLWLLGLPHDLVTAGFVDGFLSAAGYLGFMIPQGLGAFEIATVYVLGYIGGSKAQAIAFALARRGRMIVVGLFGISLHLIAVLVNAIKRRRAAA